MDVSRSQSKGGGRGAARRDGEMGEVGEEVCELSTVVSRCWTCHPWSMACRQPGTELSVLVTGSGF